MARTIPASRSARPLTTVNCEVAPADVFLRGIRIDDAVRVAAIGVTNVGAERRHFDLGVILNNQNHAEFCAHGKAVWKQLLHPLGTRVRGDVVI